MRTVTRAARAIGSAFAACLFCFGRTADADGSALEYPGQGSESLGRGGAWVARAADPIALARNPAGLAGQPLRLSVGEDLAFRRACFTRIKAASDTTDDGVAPGATYPRVCDDADPLPVGYVAVAIPLGPRGALGVGIVTPHGVPRARWPSFVDGRPAPQRHLLLESTALVVIPTVGAAVEPLGGLRLGATLGWGIAWVRSSAAARALAHDGLRPEDDDVEVRVAALDAFVPRVTLGAHATLAPTVEVGLALMWSAPVDASGEATTRVGAFSARAASGDTSKVAHGDTSQPDCGQPGGSACAGGDDARLVVPVPMQAQLGVRVRVPRRRAGRRDAHDGARDPMETEIADLEIDGAWSNDSAFGGYALRFTEGIPVPGTAGTLPREVASARRFRDGVSVRVGGDLNVVPGVLAVRAGAFVQPANGVPGYTGLEAISGTRVGAALGGTVRIAAPRGRAFDVTLAYLRVFVCDVEADRADGEGIRAPTGTSPHATRWPVSLGRIESGLDVVHVGLAHRF